MEYGLRLLCLKMRYKHFQVLILVVMEYGLRLYNYTLIFTSEVLILVVMEYGLRRFLFRRTRIILSLNPCCNGIWSQTTQETAFKK